jgi:hypothetical protein
MRLRVFDTESSARIAFFETSYAVSVTVSTPLYSVNLELEGDVDLLGIACE